MSARGRVFIRHEIAPFPRRSGAPRPLRSCGRGRSAADPLAAQVLKLAQENAVAVIAGDCERAADFTYSRIVDLAGGRAAMVTYLRNGMAEMKASGSGILSAEMSEPKEIVTVGPRRFAIVRRWSIASPRARKSAAELPDCDLLRRRQDLDVRGWTRHFEGEPARDHPGFSAGTCAAAEIGADHRAVGEVANRRPRTSGTALRAFIVRWRSLR